VVLRKKLTRDQMIRYFEQLPPTVVVLEACGSAHHWARELTRQGHAAKLIAPQLAKPFVKRGKNDAADAEGLLEASSRPSMRYVPAKTVDQQAALMLAGERARLVRESTRLANTVRGYAAEFGLIGGKGTAQIEPLLVRLRQDRAVPEMARSLFADLAADYARIGVRIAAVEARLTDWHKSNETARRLTAIPGVGRIGASLLVIIRPRASCGWAASPAPATRRCEACWWSVPPR
jgi:transposase